MWLILCLPSDGKLNKNVALPNYVDSIGSVLYEVLLRSRGIFGGSFPTL